ncbi:ABC transporter substrate-binding protein [Micromonospora sp. HM5-17]|jgi:polar amino acid transport system substrate-binding protein|uniref:ABC transporter substrate-binding protein n=1 Tax=Micromonospora sp. HM5-17 TaxID=2487710 RepID=UPI000F46E999|nr:ABC transporter substrate-binding protein [Micromonospora sp. HM5-17]ROT31107.1 ABC transporter substrate-binding protein [Micromonospora sp. HM5-17]
MFTTTRGRRRALSIAGAALLSLSLAACGEEETPAGSGPSVSAAPDSALASKVPDAIKADGKIVVGTDSTYAPAEFLDTDGKTVIGFDVELFTAVAAKLGLKAEFVSANFGDIIAGVNSGKYEVGVSSFTINDERKAQANMVSYYQVGTQWATRKGNPAGVTLDNACGKKIAVQKDTVQVEDIQARSKACTDAGKPAITIDQFPGQDAATAAVVSGKDDAMLADYPVSAYAVTQSGGQLELLDKMYDAAPYGYVVAKDQTAFAEAVRDAVKALIDDGSYRTVLEKWKVGDGAITAPAINP